MPVFPQLTIAVVCERVMREMDGVISVIRIVDTFVREPEDGARDQPGIPVNGLIALKAGDAVGEYDVRLSLRTPSKRFVDLGDQQRWNVRLNGEEHGAFLAFRFDLPADDLGLYWIDVACDGHRLGSIPVRVAASAQHSHDARTAERGLRARE